MKYCTRCLYPNTKPDLWFNEAGVCSACLAFDARASIDWRAREKEFVKLVDYYKSLRCNWDCIIPVSGGKDSTYQVVKALEYGLRPLAITASTDDLSNIGRNNLDNISKLGVDHIEITTNRQLRRKINKYTLETVGDISWAEHVTIFTIPVHAAIKFNIPLIIWGENPQNEYGGPKVAQTAMKLDQRWLEEFGGLNGLRVSDLLDVAGKFGMSEETLKRELYLYTYPNLNIHTTSGIFLGQFFPWDGIENAKIAEQNGFKRYTQAVEGTSVDYENLDNLQTGIHDHFKYIKFGFGRATDIVCNKIRRGLLDRETGKKQILWYDGQWPLTYLGVELSDILSKIDMSCDEFYKIVNQFTNKKLFAISDEGWPRPLFHKDLENA